MSEIKIPDNYPSQFKIFYLYICRAGGNKNKGVRLVNFINDWEPIGQKVLKDMEDHRKELSK